MNKVGRARAPNAIVLGADQTWTLPPLRFSAWCSFYLLFIWVIKLPGKIFLYI